MIVLYHNHMSTCSMKVRLVLTENDLDWQSQHIDLRKGENLTSQFLAMNPAGVVPVINYEGEFLAESSIICEFLDSISSKPRLTPADAWDRARMRLWTKQLDDSIHAATGVVSFCAAFRHQFLSKSPEELQAYLAGLTSDDRRERLKVSLAQGMDAPFFKPALARLTKMLDDMEDALARTAFLVGNDLTLADVALLPYVLRLEHLGMGDLVGSRPNVKKWFDAMTPRPSFRIAITEWLEPSYMRLFAEVQEETRGKISRMAL